MRAAIHFPSTPGTLDPTFGDAGKVIIPQPEHRTFVPLNMALTANSDLLICGKAVSGGRKNYEELFACLRLNPNGELDRSFGINGFATGVYDVNENATGSSSAVNIIVLPDGKILLSGFNIRADDRLSEYGMARLHADGSLDKSFGTGGTVQINRPYPSGGQRTGSHQPYHLDRRNISSSVGGKKMCVLPDGRIVVLMEFQILQPMDFGLVCLTPDGTLDTRFGNGGYAQIENNPFVFEWYGDVIAAEDGKIAVCGSGRGKNNTPTRETALLFKFTGEGAPDRSFADNGVLLFPKETPTTDHLFYGLAMQPNKRLLACGHILQSREEALLISVEPDGSPNIQFNRGQPLTAIIDGVDSIWSAAIVVQPEAKIILVGATDRQFTFARLLSDGIPDKTFAQGKAAMRYPLVYYTWVAPTQTHGNRIYFMSEEDLWCGLLS